MADGNGGSGRDVVVDVLRAIHGEVTGLRGEVREGFERVDARLERVEAKLDRLAEIAGEHWREHDERIRAIEARLGMR